MTQDNPLMARLRIPGETFRLPSRGKYYENGELSEDVVDGELQVLPMTTVDELALKSPDKLFSGKAIEEVFTRCIPQVQKPAQLLSKDVDYLMMCLRLVSYGETLELKLKHDCEEAKEHSHIIQVRDVIRKAREIDPTKVFKVTLPNDQVITLKPPVFADVIAMYQSEDQMASMENEDIANLVAQNIAGIVKDVDGTTERSHIEPWIKALPAGWVSMIADEIISVSDWGVQPTMEIKCPDCGEMWTIDVPSNPITFFT